MSSPKGVHWGCSRDRKAGTGMQELMEKVTRGTETVLRSPKLAAAFYSGALVAVMAVVVFHEED